MGRPSFSDYMEALFAPLVGAAGRPDLLRQLKTADLAEDRRSDQFERLKRSRIMGGEHVSLPPNSFVFRYRNSYGAFLCVQNEDLDPQGREQLSIWGPSGGLTETRLDKSAFLFLVYSLRGSYKPKSEFLTRDTAENVIDIIGSDYPGHSIYEVQKWYRAVAVFEIPEDHVFRSQSNYGVAANIAARMPDFRSALIPPALATAIAGLTNLPNVNPENLYFALTSAHWRHVVLEIYKCLEAAFYLPWAKNLRDALGHQMSALEMAQHCKKNLRWRENEARSIVALFQLLPEDIVIDPAIRATVGFSDIPGDIDVVAAFAKRVYKIRNQLVHQQDYDSPEPVNLDEAVWLSLALYLCKIIDILYSKFAVDLSYSYEISQDEIV